MSGMLTLEGIRGRQRELRVLRAMRRCVHLCAGPVCGAGVRYEREFGERAVLMELTPCVAGPVAAEVKYCGRAVYPERKQAEAATGEGV